MLVWGSCCPLICALSPDGPTHTIHHGSSCAWGATLPSSPTPHPSVSFLPFPPSSPDISKVQDAEVGDGTTSVVVLAAELLKEAEQLVARKLHPQTIIAGWRKATDCARAALTAAAEDHS